MSEQSTQWDRQWSELLTRCHGRDIEADAGFKAGLLDTLKRRAAEQARSAAMEDEVPAPGMSSEPGEDIALRTILTKSYQPVQPRREFETRLLENLKHRQRSNTEIRVRGHRRTLFLSTASSLAAAAAVLFVVWLGPAGGSVSGSVSTDAGDLRLPVPDAVAAVSGEADPAQPNSGLAFAAFGDSALAAEDAAASFETVPAAFASYRVEDAFQGNPLPDSAVALRNVLMNDGSGWRNLAYAQRVQLRPGSVFRAESGMGHLKFPDGSLVSISPDTLLQANDNGLTVARGFMLVAVPSSSTARFRLHFPERDIAVEPGTDLAVMVENPDKFAAGGAPAPMVMVVGSEGESAGLALARGKNGIGPLFARQLYRLDKYVTPDLPGRTLCDTERSDLDKLFEMETVREDGIPLAAFASGGVAGNGEELSNYSMVLTPAGYTKKGDRWVADNYNGEQTVKLRYLSDAYFGFANARRDLARELALGGEVVLDGGDGTFYEIIR